jgi:hypothetical protein
MENSIFEHSYHYFQCFYKYIMDLDSSVAIVTRCGLGGPGIESRWGRDFPLPSTPALGPIMPLVPMGTESFPGVKQPGRGVYHPLHLDLRLKKE